MIIKEIEYGSDVYKRALSLRYTVLRMPLGLKWSKKDLKGEENQLHYGFFSGDDKLVAFLAVKLLDNHTAKIRQMAVDKHHRGKGTGRQLLEGVEKILYKKGIRRIEMNARKTAVGFYKKVGYVVEGEEFVEVTIPHFKMARTI